MLAAILCFTGAPVQGTAQQDPQLTADGQQDFVSDVLPYPLEFVRDRINLQFSADDRAFFEDYNGAIYQLPDNAKDIHGLSKAAYRKFIAFPLVRPNKFYVFFAAYKPMQRRLQEVTPYSILGMDNPALQRYAKLSNEERSEDIYLWSPDTPYWYSQYSANGADLPFRSYFIVHLSAPDKTHTSVEIIEDNPVVNMGRKFSVDVHGIVHRFDIRPVAPTTTDREFLLSCINQFIERKLPGRHWFNCLTEQELTERKAQEERNRQLLQ
ncbi:MAG TPA: hypothetical protein VFT64_02685 [Rickettsiales bacterium]|nr:hypothetical protein [Rickettsiales bacterium]